MSNKSNQDAIKEFLISEVLSSDICITTAELKLVKVLIRSKLADMMVEVQKTNDKTGAELYNQYLLTAISLKCILSLANKIEKENDAL